MRQAEATRDVLVAGQTPIFVVSLPGSTKRHQTIAARLRELGLQFEFFDAIDGRDLPSHLEDQVDPEFGSAKQLLGRKLSAGEIGCAFSHAFLMRDIVSRQLPAAFVLEDDSYPSDDFADLVRSSSLIADSRIGLATLYYQPLRAWSLLSRRVGGRYRAYRPAQHPWHTVGYFIKLESAQRLLSHALPVSCVADWPAPIHLWPTTFCIYPRPVSTDLEPSSSLIHEERTNLETEGREKLEHRYALESWSIPQQRLGRVFSFTLLPCLLWPQVFGDWREALVVLRRVLRSLPLRLLGKTLA